MALISCYDCGQLVSESAAACPKCGAPVSATRSQEATEWRRYKAVTTFFIAIGAIWLLVTAGNNNWINKDVVGFLGFGVLLWMVGRLLNLSRTVRFIAKLTGVLR